MCKCVLSLLFTLYDINLLSIPLCYQPYTAYPPALREPLSLTQKQLQSNSAVVVQQRHHGDTGTSQQQLQHSGVVWI